MTCISFVALVRQSTVSCVPWIYRFTQPRINLAPLITAFQWSFSNGPQQHPGKSNRWPIKILTNILGILHMIWYIKKNPLNTLHRVFAPPVKALCKNDSIDIKYWMTQKMAPGLHTHTHDTLTHLNLSFSSTVGILDTPDKQHSLLTKSLVSF